MYKTLDKASMQFDDKPIRKLMHKLPEIRILTDHTTVELFFVNEVSATYTTDASNGVPLRIKEEAHIHIREWGLKSIWN